MDDDAWADAGDEDDWGDEGGDDWDDEGGDDDWGGEVDDEWGGEVDGGWGNDGDGEDEDIRVTIQNLFHQADNMQKKHPEEALEQLMQMCKLEEDSDEFKDELFMRFPALEKIVGLELRLEKYQEMLEHYNQLLLLTNRVSPNEASKAINNTLRGAEKNGDAAATEQLYMVTREHLRAEDGKGQAFFNVSMKLVNRSMEIGDFDRASGIIEELHSRCILENGEDDESKGAQLLGIYAMKLQILSERGESEAIKAIFIKTRKIVGVVSDPYYMSIIQECWGKVYATDGNWDQAFTEFWEAFLQYQQVTSPRARQCLKYVVIAEMLSSKSINPFNSREAKVLENDSEIAVMAELRSAYEMNDVRHFQTLVSAHKSKILNDPFILNNLEPLLLQSRAQTLLKMLEPYHRIQLSYLASNLQIGLDAVENLLVQLILDKKVYGKIDQIAGVLDLSQEKKSGQKFGAIENWAGAVSRLGQSLSEGQ